MLSARTSGMRRSGGAVAALILLVALTGITSRLWQYGVASPFTDPLDFRAFYCAGSAVAHHANPYRLEPDRTCQRDVLAAAGLRLNEDFILPAPLPPYALVAFAGLALLPYRLAAALWMSANILAVLLAMFLTSRLSGARPALVAPALFLSAGIVCLSLGQVVPLVLAAILFAAFSARSKNGCGAAAGATLAALEPHLALPVWLALALFVPDARRWLVAAAALLGALTFAPGVTLNVEYALSVLPQHARAELFNLEGQYGLSALLAALHMAPEYALRAGSASYVVMLAFGLALGSKLQRRSGEAAFLILAPVAAVALGGPFLHLQQTVVAIPFGFMLLARLPRYSATSGSVVAAICLLAIPWPLADMAFAPSQVPAGLRSSAARVPERPRFTTPNVSIEIPYAAFIARFERRPNKHSAAELISRKSPTWLALIGLLLAASWLAYGPCRVRPATVYALKAA